jgi:hypothetical protein
VLVLRTQCTPPADAVAWGAVLLLLRRTYTSYREERGIAGDGRPYIHYYLVSSCPLAAQHVLRSCHAWMHEQHSRAGCPTRPLLLMQLLRILRSRHPLGVVLPKGTAVTFVHCISVSGHHQYH